ncbi:MAG: histidine phosphatase family protein [Notoacmeibacter sp.]
MRLLLVRHGQSEWNAAKRLQGQADIDLSVLGKSQAELLAPTVRSLKPDRVISSDLLRARHTAALLGFHDAELRTGLREISVGDWTGRAIPEIMAESPLAYAGWRAGTNAPPGGEIWADFTLRAAQAIELERATFAKGTLLAVCHGGVIRALVQYYLGLDPLSVIPVGPASLTSIRLSADRSKPSRLELFNYRPGSLELDAPD